MSNEEALQRFKLFSEAFEMSGLPTGASEVAIKSIEKQIPLPSLKDSCPERTLHKCPGCKKYIFVTEYADGALCGGRKSKYCPECGQAMEWKK